MKVIFLDVDGVLNCQTTEDLCGGYLGIEDRLVKNLKEIVDKTGANIILCSSWKTHWHKERKSEQGNLGIYLDRKLRKHHLTILDKTNDHGSDRGHGIRRYLAENPKVTSWCVLDDDIFGDYDECEIMDHLVHTEFYRPHGGLCEEHVQKAMEILNKNE